MALKALNSLPLKLMEKTREKNKISIGTNFTTMKQTALLIIFFLGIGFLSSFTKRSNDCKDIDYTVIKIDSIKNWYLIYATRNDSVFKIVSMKNQICKCEIIFIGKRYRLELQKRLENVLSKDGLKILPMNYSDIKGLFFDQNTDVFMPCEKGTYGLYSCKNMEGLCIVKK